MSAVDPSTAFSQSVAIESSRLLDRAMGGRCWQLEVDVAGMPARLQGIRPERDDMAGPYACVQGTVGQHSAKLVLPVALLDVLLSRAPDPVSLSDLAAQDAGLLVEHVLTPMLDLFEKATGLLVRLSEVRDDFVITRPPHLQVELAGQRFPLDLFLDDPIAGGRLAGLLDDRDRRGPDIPPGARVAIGPIHVSAEDLARLEPGDEIDLDDVLPHSLRGVVWIDDERLWPVEILRDRVLLGQAVVHAARGDQPLGSTLFLSVAQTSERYAPAPGLVIPISRYGDDRTSLFLDGGALALAALVVEGGRVAIRIDRTL